MTYVKVLLEKLVNLNTEMLELVSDYETEKLNYEHYLVLLRMKNSLLEQLNAGLLNTNRESESGSGIDSEISELYSRLVGLEYELRDCLEKKKKVTFDKLKKISNVRNSKGKYSKNDTMVFNGSFLSLSTGE